MDDAFGSGVIEFQEGFISSDSQHEEFSLRSVTNFLCTGLALHPNLDICDVVETHVELGQTHKFSLGPRSSSQVHTAIGDI